MAEILIIDDEVHIRILYTEFLTREGHNITTAANAEEARQWLKKKTFDLVILDIELQDSNGLEVLKELKAANHSLPIILNSAYSVYKSDFGSWMADAYVLKSSDLIPLQEKIKELLGNQCQKGI